MTTNYPVCIERLSGAGIIRVAAKHNLREIAAEIGAGSHIDAARIEDNFILRGPDTAADVVLTAKSLMSAAGITKLRKNAVTALELLFTLPSHSAIDARSFFEDATCWAARHFSVPILSSVVHLDEAVPHCHVLMLPLANGKMNGSDLHGGRAKLAAMQASFHKEVGANYGFIRHAPKKRLSATEREAALECARQHFKKKYAMTVDEISVLLKPHAADPIALLRGLGITVDSVRFKSKSFVEIMTAPCKPERRNPIGKVIHDPIGIAENCIPMNSFPYTCVGKGFDALSVSTNSEKHGTGVVPSTSSGWYELCNVANCAPPTQQIDGYSAMMLIEPNSHTMNFAAQDPSQTSDTSGTSTTSGEKATERNSRVPCDLHSAVAIENLSFLRHRRGFINWKPRTRHPKEGLGSTVHPHITLGDSECHRPSFEGFHYPRRRPGRRTSTTRNKWLASGSARYTPASQLVSVKGGIRDPPDELANFSPTSAPRLSLRTIALSSQREGGKSWAHILLERAHRAEGCKACTVKRGLAAT